MGNDDGSLQVREYRIVGRQPERCGQTTFIDATTGFVASTGRLTFGGHDVHGQSSPRS